MANIFQSILRNRFNITDIINFDYKYIIGRKPSNKNVRGSVRSQLGKFLSDDQFEENMNTIEKNPLP